MVGHYRNQTKKENPLPLGMILGYIPDNKLEGGLVTHVLNSMLRDGEKWVEFIEKEFKGNYELFAKELVRKQSEDNSELKAAYAFLEGSSNREYGNKLNPRHVNFGFV